MQGTEIAAAVPNAFPASPSNIVSLFNAIRIRGGVEERREGGSQGTNGVSERWERGRWGF